MDQPKDLWVIYCHDVKVVLYLTLREGGKAPKFPEKPSIKMASGKVVMSVVVEAAPQPMVSWYKGTTEISSGGNIRIYTEKSEKADTYTLILEIAVSI